MVTRGTPAGTPDPPHNLEALADENIVDLDVREELRGGGEPFSRIMAARSSVPPDGALRLRAIFEPVPLYAVMAKQGFDHWTERLADDDWCVWFFRAEASRAEEPTEDPTPVPDADTNPDEDAGVVVLDVRGLEPPEPMVRTLEALERLPKGGTLVQINVRVPRFLLPELEARGFTHEIREQSEDLVRLFIRHQAAD